MLFFILFSTITYAGNYEIFNEANTLYQQKNYKKAIEKYQSLIKSNNVSSDVYYNLGNCYYKIDQISSAILNYEKALKLKPDNMDAFYNLNLANKKTIDKVDRLPELFIANSWRKLITSKTVKNWAIYTISLVFLSLIFFITYLLTNQLLIKKSGFYGGSIFLLMALFCWLLASQHQKIDNSSSEAIIFANTVTITSEPTETSEKLFTLHEGTKVKLLEHVNGWYNIKLPNGNVGWLKSKDLQEI